MRSLSQSAFFLVTSVIQPVIFATIAFYMFKAGVREESLLYAALGAGLMGVWGSTLFGSGALLQWERWQGTLELLVAAPRPFVLIVLPMTLSTSIVGVYSLVATLVWGRLVFGVPLALAHPFLFALALVATLVSLGLLGLLIASSFVLYRHASALTTFLTYPVWLVAGLLVPASALPGWAASLGWFLAPSWGGRALREAAFGGDPLPAIGMSLLLGAVYVAVAALVLRVFLRLARERATLSLT
ncbi:MAG: ABC transporter permease [Thermoleophilia bacterium]|nr:ABC transporter permease [Thermoleophilia bacterium]